MSVEEKHHFVPAQFHDDCARCGSPFGNWVHMQAMSDKTLERTLKAMREERDGLNARLALIQTRCNDLLLEQRNRESAKECKCSTYGKRYCNFHCDELRPPT